MPPNRAARLLLPVIYLGFISLGLPDGTLGVAWPSAHRELALPLGLAGVIMLIITLLAGVASFNSARVIRRFRTGPVVLVSSFLTATGLLLLSQSESLGWLLLAALPLGAGAGAVDAGLNGYVARHYSARHMNWLHACWGIGATCGPIVLANAMGRGAGWRGGYLALGLAQLALAGIFLATLRLWQLVPERSFGTDHAPATGANPAAQANSAAGWLSSANFVLYVAIETTTGLWAGSILVEARGLPAVTAALCVSLYYGSITAGRLLSGLAVERWGNRAIVTSGMLLALVGAVLFLLAHTPIVAGLALVLTGLGFAPVYPCLMHEVPRRFAPEAVATVIGRQSGAAYLGSASLPVAAGWLAQWSLESIPLVVIAGLLVLLACVRALDRMT